MSKKDQRVTFMSSPELVKELEAAARASHETVSQYVRKALRARMELRKEMEVEDPRRNAGAYRVERGADGVVRPVEKL